MVSARRRRLQLWVSKAALSAMSVMAAACGYPELPLLPDAPDAALPPLVEGPSCKDLPKTCGANADESCCRAEWVPGGTFDRSNDPRFPATVSTFALDTYEVTVGRFRAFFDAGLGTKVMPPEDGTGAHPQIPGSGWAWSDDLPGTKDELKAKVSCNGGQPTQTWTDSAGVNEDKAINCVPWAVAMAFCIWDGGYLPTEAEWNYAASGGNEQRVYPWSDPKEPSQDPLIIDCTYANARVNTPAGTYCESGPMGGVNRVGSEAPKGNGRWHHADLAGNVSEWTLDKYHAQYSSMPCNDCVDFEGTGSLRVLRGGSYTDEAMALRTGHRDNLSEASGGLHLGFRCARPAP